MDEKSKEEKEKLVLVKPTPGEVSRFAPPPIKQTLQVFSADPVTAKKPTEFMVTEYCGTPLLREAGFRKWLEIKGDVPEDYWLTNADDLSQGDVVYCESLFGWMKMTVKPMEGGGFILDTDPDEPNEGTLGFIKFDADPRHCWVCWGHANKKAMAMSRKTIPDV